MKIFSLTSFAAILILSTNTFAQPVFKQCVSDDTKVRIDFSTKSDGSAMVDLNIQSNDPNRPAEFTFPCVESKNADKVIYTLSDSQFELLSVDLSTHKGKMWGGFTGGPNTMINVTCSE